jgi:hypothetical protein
MFFPHGSFSETQLTPIFQPRFRANPDFIRLQDNRFQLKTYRKFFCVSKK